MVIESVKAASDILAPIDGEIVEKSTTLWSTTPGLANEDALGEGWFFKIKPDDASPDGRITWTKPRTRN